MSVNKYKPHIFVLPEDDANSDIANGFLLHDAIDLRAIQILSSARGWPHLREQFISEHVPEMQKNSNRHAVLLVDFDQKEDRRAVMTKDVPENVANRVFVVGVWSEPEDLPRANLGSKEVVGQTLARECFDDSRDVWNHELLRHNGTELERMSQQLRPIIFTPK